MGETVPRRGAVSHRYVWVGLVALALVVLGTFVIGYWVLVRYERKVARHLPEDLIAALRIDVEQVVLYEPIRKHVFPVLDGVSRMEGASSAEGGKGRLARFRELSGVNLGMDLREVAVGIDASGWVLLVGGLFPDAGLVGDIAQLLRETAPATACETLDDELHCSGGLTVAQALDGVLVVGSNAALVKAALPANDSPDARKQTGELSLVASVPRLFENRALAAMSYMLGASWLAKVQRIAGTVRLGDPLRVELALEGLAPTAINDVQASLQRVQQLAADTPGPDWAGERALLAQARVEQQGGRPVIVAPWEKNDVERAAAALGNWLEHRLEQP